MSERLHVAVRPEAMHLSAHAEEGAANRLPGHIRHRIFKGPHPSLEIDIGEGRTLNALIHSDTLAPVGDEVFVGRPAESATVLRG